MLIFRVELKMEVSNSSRVFMIISVKEIRIQSLTDSTVNITYTEDDDDDGGMTIDCGVI